MTNIVREMADIERRLRGLKAERKVDITQLQMLSEQWTDSLSIASFGYAQYEVQIVCGGDPIADIALSGFPAGKIVYGSISWQLVGNTAIANVYISNGELTTEGLTLTISAYALNGISVTCERIV